MLFQQLITLLSSMYKTRLDLTKGLVIDDLTPLQYNIMEFLAVQQPVSLSRLSECLHLSLPNASRELKKLYAKGWCHKETAPDDKRKQVIRLSERGQARMDEAFAIMRQRFLEQLAPLSSKEREEIGAAIKLLQETVFHTEG